MSNSQSPPEDYVEVEKPKLSLSAVLLLAVVIMQFITMLLMVNYFTNETARLKTEIEMLRIQIKELNQNLGSMNKYLQKYEKLDLLVQAIIEGLYRKIASEIGAFTANVTSTR